MGDGVDEVLEKRRRSLRALVNAPNKGKIKQSNSVCPDWSIVYLAQLKSTSPPTQAFLGELVFHPCGEG